MLDNIKKYHIILGSQSPRRKELLSGLDIDFEIRIVDIEENFPKEMVGVEIPMHIAQKKATAFTLKENDLLITADTIVWFNGKVYSKPTDRNDAKNMGGALF